MLIALSKVRAQMLSSSIFMLTSIGLRFASFQNPNAKFIKAINRYSHYHERENVGWSDDGGDNHNYYESNRPILLQHIGVDYFHFAQNVGEHR